MVFSLLKKKAPFATMAKKVMTDSSVWIIMALKKFQQEPAMLF